MNVMLVIYLFITYKQCDDGVEEPVVKALVTELVLEVEKVIRV